MFLPSHSKINSKKLKIAVIFLIGISLIVKNKIPPIQAADYTMMPLLLSSQSIPGYSDLRGQIAYNLAYDQGYQVQCAYPDWTINTQTFGEIQKYFQQPSADAVNLGSSVDYTVDVASLTVPLFRDDVPESQTRKNTDFEGYFGANQLHDIPDDETPDINDQGAIAQLLSQESQCIYKINLLASLKQICDGQTDPTTCTLNTLIPGSTLKLFDLHKQMSDLADPAIGFTCSELAQTWNPDFQTQFGITQDKFLELQSLVKAMPFNVKGLYRIAFFIISVTQDIRSGGNDAFWFLSDQNPETNAVRKVPIIVAFKIPDFLTNKAYSITHHTDSAQTTAYAINTYEFNSQQILEESQRRQAFLDAIVTKRNDTNPPFNCTGVGQCADPDPGKQALARALVDLINGANPSCTTLTREQGGVNIGTSGSLTGGNLFDSPPIPGSSATQKFNWELTISKENQKPQGSVTLSAYIIAPLGASIDDIYESLTAIWGDETLQQTIAENIMVDEGGRKGEVAETFSAPLEAGGMGESEDEFTYSINLISCLQNPEANCSSGSFGAKLTELGARVNEIRIFGAKIGFLIRKFQELLTDYNNPARLAAANCYRAKDLFEGKCSLDIFDQIGEDAGSCQAILDTVMPVPTLAEWKDMIASAATRHGISPELLWGVFSTEGTPFKTAICQGASELQCYASSAGAVGPFQILSYYCVADDYFAKNTPWLQQNTKNYCDLDVALDTAASMLATFNIAGGGTAEASYAWYGGFKSHIQADGTCDDSTEKPQGCCRSEEYILNANGDYQCVTPTMNYCECADYFGQQFEDFQC